MTTDGFSVRDFTLMVAIGLSATACYSGGGSGGDGDGSDADGSDVADLDTGDAGDTGFDDTGVDDAVGDGSETSCPDGDDDGVCDDVDICAGFDDAVDGDGDGVPDGCDVCADGDDAADADGDAIPDACDVELVALRVEPIDVVVEADLGAVGVADFTATAVFSDGTEVDVTDEANWSIGESSFGQIEDGTLTTPALPATFVDSTIVSATWTDGAETETGETFVTVAAYRRSGDTPDFLFVLPFLDRTGSKTAEIDVATARTKLDVFFNADTTGSMDDPLTLMQDSLAETILPGIRSIVADAAIGVGAYEDFPVAPFGEASCSYGALGGPDQPFELFAEVTTDDDAIDDGFDALAIGGNAIGCGNDGPESALEGLYQIATGEGLTGPGPTYVAPNSSGIGGVGFRSGALPIVVTLTDSISHDVDTDATCVEQAYTGEVAAVAHGQDETMEALNAICARVIHFSNKPGSICTAQADGVEWSVATGAVVAPAAWDVDGRPAGCAPSQCCTGVFGAGQTPVEGMCPLTYLFGATGNGLAQGTLDAIEMLARFTPLDVRGDWSGSNHDNEGNRLPLGTSTADFINVVLPVRYHDVPASGFEPPVFTETTFEDVVPGTGVVFGLSVFNDVLPQADEPQHVIVTIRFLADDCLTIDTRDVLIVVPPLDDSDDR